MIPAAYIPAARESLKDLRLTLISEGLSELRARGLIYEWLVRTADRVLPGGGAEAHKFVDAALLDLAGTPAPVVVDPPRPAGGVRIVNGAPRFSASLLVGWNGGKCPFFALSQKTNDAEFAFALSASKDRGATAIMPYLLCERDGDREHPVDVRRNASQAKARLAAARAAGLGVVAFGFADDSPGLKALDADSQANFLIGSIEAIGGPAALDALITHLEGDEQRNDDKVRAVVAHLHARFPSLPLAVHGVPGAEAKWSRIPGVSWVSSQLFGPGGTPPSASAVASAARKAIAASALPVHFTEYDFDTPAAIHMGDAILDAVGSDPRCLGIGGPVTLAKVRAWNAQTPGNAPAPVSGPQLISVTKSKREDYINWECSADVDKWTARPGEDGRPLNGVIEINGIKCEKFRPTYRTQHLRNAWGNDEHRVPGLVKGQPCTIRLVALFEKSATNPVQFVWPFRST